MHVSVASLLHPMTHPGPVCVHPWCCLGVPHLWGHSDSSLRTLWYHWETEREGQWNWKNRIWDTVPCMRYSWVKLVFPWAFQFTQSFRTYMHGFILAIGNDTNNVCWKKKKNIFGKPIILSVISAPFYPISSSASAWSVHWLVVVHLKLYNKNESCTWFSYIKVNMVPVGQDEHH